MNIIKDYNECKQSGEVIDIGKDYIDIAASEGIVRIFELQFPGKKRMTVEQFLVGNTIPKGIILHKED